MKFKINNTEWTIEEVDEATINNEMKPDGTLGVTIYRTQTIMLLKDQANIIKTLKHELTHVWLFEYGHNQNDDKSDPYDWFHKAPSISYSMFILYYNFLYFSSILDHP